MPDLNHITALNPSLMNIGSILVVCTGNICRSPVAEHLLRARLTDSSVRVDSAGTMAMAGSDAHPESLASLERRGYALTNHRAKQLDANLLGNSDLTLVLDRTHRLWISRNFPQYLGRVFKLGFWDGDADVTDPYLKSPEMFDLVYNDIDRYTNSWLKRLQKS